MIKLISRFETENIIDPNYIKIAASIKAYGTSRPFCTSWRQGDTLLCRIDGNMTLYGEDFDPEEIKSFISAVGAKTLCCSASAAEKLGYDYKKYKVMRADKGARVAAEFEPSLDLVYKLLCEGEDGEITLPDREAFIADLSHRTRHGTALSVVYKSAVCVIPYITDSGALICGVATEKSARGSGFAGMCVNAAVSRVNRPTLVICEDSLVPFYKKFGFYECGENAEIKF